VLVLNKSLQQVASPSAYILLIGYGLFFKVVIQPVILSVVVALTIEILLYIFLLIFSCELFAFFLSKLEAVSKIAAYMWQIID
jgi:hypothetical protein